MKIWIALVWGCGVVTLLCFLFAMSGCSLPLTADIINALSNDTASFCAKTGARGGAGGLATGALAGYGQMDLLFCRSNFPNAKVMLNIDGSISITHGAVE
mgnify:CR=1 FL=1